MLDSFIDRRSILKHDSFVKEGFGVSLSSCTIIHARVLKVENTTWFMYHVSCEFLKQMTLIILIRNLCTKGFQCFQSDVLVLCSWCRMTKMWACGRPLFWNLIKWVHTILIQNIQSLNISSQIIFSCEWKMCVEYLAYPVLFKMAKDFLEAMVMLG